MTSLSRPLTPIIVFLNFLVCSFEACVGLGQIAKLSPDTLAWCAEFGSSDLVAGLHCLLPSASNVLPSTFNLSGEVTSVSAARCLLMYCQVPSICLGESLLCLGSPKFFNNSVCWVIPLFQQGPDFVRQIFCRVLLFLD